jgi:hypothetical protein
MQVKLRRTQRYISADGTVKTGNKGDIVNVAREFYKHISKVCEIVIEKKEEPKKKPLDKMNKEELLQEVKALGIELTDEQKEDTKKADLIALIEDFAK